MDYKIQLEKLVKIKKKDIPTLMTDLATKKIFEILEETPRYLNAVSKHFDESSSLEPIMVNKRSFRETLIHFLNIESLHYTTIYLVFLLNNPKIFPLHAERDIDRLNLFLNFQMSDLLLAFDFERRKTINFLRALKGADWSRKLTEENKERQETIYWRARGLSIHDYTHIHILKFQLGEQKKRDLPIKQ